MACLPPSYKKRDGTAMDWQNRVLEEIDKCQDELIELCAKLIQFPSENPPGDTRDISKFITDYLQQAGVESSAHESAPNMLNLLSTIGSPAENGKHLLFCGHSDVVPAGDLSRWDFPPFSGLVKDGYIHGRGASDMKCGLGGLIFVTALLKRLNVPLNGQLSLFVVPDEETGGHNGVPWVLDRGLISGTAAVIAEPSSALHPTIGQKGSAWFEFTVEGKPGHGSLAPFKGDNAIVKAAKAVLALQQLTEMKPDIPEDVREMIEISKNYVKTREVVDVRPVFDHVTVNIGTIQGGTKANVIADRCTVQVDSRVPFGIDYQDVLAEAKRILLEQGIDSELKPIGFRGNANWTPPAEEIVKYLVESISEISGQEAYGVLQWATSDARHFRRHGIPVLQYGPADLTTIHNFNERAPVAEVIQAAKVYAVTALKYLGVKP